MNLNQAEALEVSRDPFHTALDPSDILLTGQAAIVTGAGGGIGQGIALGLAKFGADVAVLDIDPERAERTAASITEMGRDALVLPADVMDTEQVTAAVAQSAEHFGHLNILVNNAGGVSGRLFLEQSERSWRRHIDINLVEHARGHPCGRARDEGERRRLDRERHEHRGHARRADVRCVRRLQGRPDQLHDDDGPRAVGASHPHQLRSTPDQTIPPGLRGNRAGPVDPSTWPEARTPKAPAAPCTRSRRVVKVSSRTARPLRSSCVRRWARTSPAPRSTSTGEPTPLAAGPAPPRTAGPSTTR